MTRIHTVLTIAGFDGSGGAGIQADLKTFSALGCFGTTVLTALPVQNTLGVRSVYPISTCCVEEQIEAIFDDIEVDAIKIGMLHREEVIESVAKVLSRYPLPPLVLDPVMVAKSGDLLLLPSAIQKMQETLIPMTTVLTPNLLEASKLLRREVSSEEHMEQAALDLLKMGARAVVVKGGHLQGHCNDCLCLNARETYWSSSPRIHTKNTHGTGCTFSSAIAAFLARKFPLIEAVSHAKQYLTESIQAGADLTIGRGQGPVHHLHALWKCEFDFDSTDSKRFHRNL